MVLENLINMVGPYGKQRLVGDKLSTLKQDGRDHHALVQTALAIATNPGMAGTKD